MIASALALGGKALAAVRTIRLRDLVAFTVGVALAFPLGQCSGVRIEKDRAKVAQAAQERRSGEAREAAAQQRGQDTAAVTAASKGRTDAIQAAPRGRPGPAQHALNCERLRARGVKLPAECG